jgi:hypothetical protein
MLDIDGNGEGDALTDGILGIRSFAGFTGDALTNGAIGSDATRSDASAIANHIQNFLPLEEEATLPEMASLPTLSFPENLGEEASIGLDGAVNGIVDFNQVEIHESEL